MISRVDCRVFKLRQDLHHSHGHDANAHCHGADILVRHCHRDRCSDTTGEVTSTPMASTSPSKEQPVGASGADANNIDSVPVQPTDTFPTRVSMTEAQKMLNAGKAIIVDVRSRQDYAAEHIKGAISIPLAEVVARMAELPKDKTIITWTVRDCTSTPAPVRRSTFATTE